MPSIGSILRMLGSVPGRIRDAQYDDDPILQERRASIPFPGGLGEEESMAEVPTGEYEEVGRRNRRPNALGRVLPEMLRGAIVAAARPSTNNTAGDIFGSMQAVSEDKQGRDMLARDIERQNRQDVMKERIDSARARDYESQADLNEWRAQQEPRQSGKVAVTPVEKVRQLEQALGRPLTEREKQTAVGLFGQQYDVRSEDTYWARRLEQAKSPDELAAIWTERAEKTGLIAEKKAEGQVKGKGPPFVRGQVVQTKEGTRWGMPPMMRGGKVVSEGTLSDPIAQRPDPRPRAPREESASDKRFERDTKVKSIVNRLLSEDSARSPETTLRNVQQYYQNDPDVQQYRAEIISALQGLMRGEGAAAKGSAAADEVDRAEKFRREREARKQGGAFKFTREYNGAKYGRNSETDPWKKIQ